MRQHRTMALLAALAALLLLPATGTTAPADPVHGPGCADITLSDSSQSGPPAYRGTEGGSATVDSLITAAKPSCSGVVYTISIYTDASQSTLIASMPFNGDDTTSAFPWSYTFATGAPHSVCVAATSSRGGHLIDAAPNTGCFTLVINSSGGGSGIN